MPGEPLYKPGVEGESHIKKTDMLTLPFSRYPADKLPASENPPITSLSESFSFALLGQVHSQRFFFFHLHRKFVRRLFRRLKKTALVPLRLFRQKTSTEEAFACAKKKYVRGYLSISLFYFTFFLTFIGNSHLIGMECNNRLKCWFRTGTNWG